VLSKMSLSSNSVYSIVFTYNPYVLTRPYWHLTFKALIGPHCIASHAFHKIIVLIIGFGDWAHTCKMDTLTSCQKWTHHPSTRVCLLFDELSDNNASDDGFISTVYSSSLWILCFICSFTSSNWITLDNNAILMAYQINTH